MSPEKATAMKRNLKLGRNTYMEIVKNVGPHALPSRSAVKKHEDSIKIPLTEFMGGYKAEFKEAIKITIQRILSLNAANLWNESVFEIQPAGAEMSHKTR